MVGELTSWHLGGRRRLFLRQPMMKQITKQKTMIPQTMATEMKSRRLLRLSLLSPPTGGGNAAVDESCWVLPTRTVVGIVVNERTTELSRQTSFIKRPLYTNTYS